MMEAIRKYKDKSHIFVKSKFEKEDGAGWLLLQQLIIAPMSLITTVLLARILSIEDYGFYKYILYSYNFFPFDFRSYGVNYPPLSLSV